MSLELLMLGDAPVARLAEQAQFAETCGFDAVWLADERFYREVYGALARIAVATSRVRLGPCVTDPFARHPALTAMAIATLDEISDGRALLGLGAGVSGFAELGIQPRRPPRAIRESIALIRALLRGEQVDLQGEVISFRDGHLSFRPVRADVPIHVASNGPLGQRAAGAVADGAIMQACGSALETLAYAANVRRGVQAAGRDAGTVRLTARLDACVAADGDRARNIVRPGVARLLGRGSLRLATAEAQRLTLPPEATAPMANARYAEGVKPYLPLLPLVTDRHVDAFALAGTRQHRKAYGLAPVRSFTDITGESTDQFPRGTTINTPGILDFTKLFDINGNPIALDSPDAQEDAVVGIRKTTLAARLKAIYGDVNKVDAFVGMVSEKHVAGTEFGPLQLAMWTKQFTALRDGDRFFYANDPVLDLIRRAYGVDYRVTLSQLLKLDAGASVQANAFKVPSP